MIAETCITTTRHPMQHVRAQLRALGILSLPNSGRGVRVRVGGVVAHRQRPATASGVTFMNTAADSLRGDRDGGPAD
jgi:error-prone DNA polymerase